MDNDRGRLTYALSVGSQVLHVTYVSAMLADLGFQLCLLFYA
jgi:hypothetical protein